MALRFSGQKQDLLQLPEVFFISLTRNIASKYHFSFSAVVYAMLHAPEKLAAGLLDKLE